MPHLLIAALFTMFVAACGPTPEETFAKRIGLAEIDKVANRDVPIDTLGFGSISIQGKRRALSLPSRLPTPTPDELFDWAEKRFPEIFPSREKTLEWSSYKFRYYPTVDLYLAVDASSVLALGKPTNGAVLNLGSIADFAALVYADRWSISEVIAAGVINTVAVAPMKEGHFDLLATGDLNADGYDDLVIGPKVFIQTLDSFEYVKLIIAFYQPNSNTFAPDSALQARMPQMQWAHSAYVGDLNSDGFNDLIVVGTGPDQGQPCGEAPVLMLGSETGLFDASDRLPRLSMYTHQWAYGDFNEDGKTDFFFINNPWPPDHPSDTVRLAQCTYRRFPGTKNQILALSNQAGGWDASTPKIGSEVFSKVSGGGSLTNNDPFPSRSFTAATAADIDADGKVDIVVYGNNSDPTTRARVFVLRGDGKGAFSVSAVIDASPFNANQTIAGAISAYDLDGDGIREIVINLAEQVPNVFAWQGSSYVVLKSVLGSLSSWTNETAKFFPQQQFSPLDSELVYCMGMTFVDINGDGLNDLSCNAMKEFGSLTESSSTPRIWLRTLSGFVGSVPSTPYAQGKFAGLQPIRLGGSVWLVGLNRWYNVTTFGPNELAVHLAR